MSHSNLTPNKKNKKNKDFKHVELNYGYFKHGDVIGGYMRQTKDGKDVECNAVEALTNHAEYLRHLAEMTDKIVAIISKYDIKDISLDANCHYVALHAPTKCTEELDQADCVIHWEGEEDFDDEYDDDFDDIDDDDDNILDDSDTDIQICFFKTNIQICFFKTKSIKFCITSRDSDGRVILFSHPGGIASKPFERPEMAPVI